VTKWRTSSVPTYQLTTSGKPYNGAINWVYDVIATDLPKDALFYSLW